MKRILVVIDMQQDFVDGALGSQEAESIVDSVVRKIKSYPIENVIATRDTHTEDYLNTQEGSILPVVHCVRNTPGWALVPAVAAVLDGVPVIDKPCFGSIELMQKLSALAEQEPIEVELVGLCTDICVVSNALLLKSAMPEVPISVDPTCCAGVTVKSHLAALKTMEMCQISLLGQSN